MNDRPEYKQQMERAQEKAEHAKDDLERQAWLDLAANWARLAGLPEAPPASPVAPPPPQSVTQQMQQTPQAKLEDDKPEDV